MPPRISKLIHCVRIFAIVFFILLLPHENESFMGWRFHHPFVVPSVRSRSSTFMVAEGSVFESFYMGTFQKLQLAQNLSFISLESSFRSAVGKVGKSIVNFEAEAFESQLIRYARLVSFVGEGYDVFNFIALPRLCVELPILGIDIVSLPGGSLAAIDFQPFSSDEAIFDRPLYNALNATYSNWKDTFPTGGELPEEAKRFFSPYVLWTRIPSEKSANVESLASGGVGDASAPRPLPSRALSPTMTLVGQALSDYVDCYVSLVQAEMKRISDGDMRKLDEKVVAEREKFLKEYLDYRIDKDPAKKLLQAAFGAEWTSRALNEVIFPKL